MAISTERLHYLFERMTQKHSTPEELDEFWEAIRSLPDDDPLLQELNWLWKNTGITPLQQKPDWDKTLSEIKNRIAESENEPATIAPARSIFPGWIRYAAAILIVAGIGALTWSISKKEKPYITQKENPSPIINDIAPGGHKAVLTLADGATIVLDSAAIGQLSLQHGSIVIKNADGQVEYRHAPASNRQSNATGHRTDRQVAFNTMSTPKGGQYMLILPDQTKVWLNAASRITYPTVFSGNERNVTVKGEAYFEVAKDASKPFKVKVNGSHLQQSYDIEVLGTHFNVNAYHDEKNLRTTLVEGKVNIRSSGEQLTLLPGQQASIQEGNLRLNKKPNVEEILAWKNGLFYFESADLETILREFARWYDIELIYEDPVNNEKYFTIMNRNTSLSSVLKSLQANKVKFRIEGKKLFVQSN